MSQLQQNNNTQQVSTAVWKGAQSSKFSGGRFHLNHPRDQLDQFVSSENSAQVTNSGKKTFSQKYTENQFKESRPHLRTFQSKYKRSTFFDQENLTKLIKIPFQSDSQMRTNVQLENKYNYATIGTSKVKAMQNGTKKHGIYRNFYNSQFKSTNTIQPFS